MDSEVVKVKVGKEEFGEVVHMGAYAILLGPYKLTVHVINSGSTLSFRQIEYFFNHCKAICIDAVHKSPRDLSIATNESTEEMEKLSSKKATNERRAFLGLVTNAFRSLANVNPSQIEDELKAALKTGKSKKVLVWVRGAGDGRSMTDAALDEICSLLINAGFTPVIIGKNPSKPIKNAISIVDLHKRLFSFENTFGRQASMYFKLSELGVVAQVGLQSGGMDYAAFCGIPTANITSKVSGDRMKALTQISNIKNIGFDEKKYQATAGQKLPAGTAKSAIDTIQLLTS